MDFKIAFKHLRKNAGLTLRQVEDKTGISNAYLSQLENDKIENPSFNVVYKICEAYNYEVIIQPKSKWINPDEKAPELYQSVSFIVSGSERYNNRVLGGTYQGFRYGYHEFSTPGISFQGKLWQPAPIFNP